MKRTATKMMLATLAGTVMLAAIWTSPVEAGIHVGVQYTSAPVDVRVWLDRGYEHDVYYDDGYGYDEYDVYPSADDVVLYVRAARSCYTTVYVIDTEGFIHVIHPFSPYDDAYLVGGRVYRYRLSDYGFHGGCFGRGVAFAYAVSSPVPFTYGYYGVGIFGQHVGFQIYGDPFVASRLFYTSILPPACGRGVIAVSYARFYVREYVRYPHYLCLGWHEPSVHCRGQCGAHRQYRIHAKDPYRVLHPGREIPQDYVRSAKINRTNAKDLADVRVSPTVRTKPSQPIRRERDHVKELVPERRVTQDVTVRKSRVIRSTRDSFIKSKQDFRRIREQLDNQDGRVRSGSHDTKTERTAGLEKRATFTKRAQAAKPSQKESQKIAVRDGRPSRVEKESRKKDDGTRSQKESSARKSTRRTKS